jgi:adenylate kinase
LKQRVVLLGPPASGKGTQASLLGATFGIPHTSTGEMLRRERAAGTSLGIEADTYTRQGFLFPDHLALTVVEQWVDDRERFLLDGFPRTLSQAQAFDRMLLDRARPLDVVYLLALSDAEVRRRMLGRLTCESCGAVYNSEFHKITADSPCPKCTGHLARRSDDTEEALDHRLSQYHELTTPVATYYRDLGLLKTIDVSPGRDEVFKTLYADMREAA